MLYIDVVEYYAVIKNDGVDKYVMGRRDFQDVK